MAGLKWESRGIGLGKGRNSEALIRERGTWEDQLSRGRARLEFLEGDERAAAEKQIAHFGREIAKLKAKLGGQ